MVRIFKINKKNQNSTTLADHVGNERLRESEQNKHHQKKSTNKTCSVLMKQRSCRKLRNNTNGFEENDKMKTLRGLVYPEYIVLRQ